MHSLLTLLYGWQLLKILSNVKTNLGRKFLLVVDKCFPKNHPLNKIFNRHTLKLSYSCMPNMKAVISSHNKNMLPQDHGATATPLQQPRTCNCKNRSKCPLQGNCVKENVVYQATVATETTTETYVGHPSCRTRLKFQRTISKPSNILQAPQQKTRDPSILVQYCRTDTTREWLDTTCTTRTTRTGRETMVYGLYRSCINGDMHIISNTAL